MPLNRPTTKAYVLTHRQTASSALIRSSVKSRNAQETCRWPESSKRDDISPSSASTQYNVRRGRSMRRLEGHRTPFVTSWTTSLASTFIDRIRGVDPQSLQYSFLAACDNDTYWVNYTIILFTLTVPTAWRRDFVITSLTLPIPCVYDRTVII